MSNGVRLTKRSFRALRRGGYKYKSSRGGRVTIIGRGRPPKSIFPKARFKWLRGITY